MDKYNTIPYNKPFHSYWCACALGRVNRYPESCHWRIKNALKEYHWIVVKV